jgi:hypothetical protein
MSEPEPDDGPEIPTDKLPDDVPDDEVEKDA